MLRLWKKQLKLAILSDLLPFITRTVTF